MQEKGMKEDEMAGSHDQLNGHEFEQAPGNDEEQGSLACCSPWGCKQSDRTKRLNNKDCLKIKLAMTCEMLRGTDKSTAVIII